MATLTVKNIPDDLYGLLKEAAAVHRRSLNSEILICLERSLLPRRRDPAELVARARSLRRRTEEAGITMTSITAARRQGRA